MAENLLKAADAYLLRMPRALLYSFAALGVWTFLRKAVLPVLYFGHYHCSRRPDFAAKYGKGSYAVVTGASDGLGELIAYELAGMGFSLVLVGRNEDKLNVVKAKCVVELRTNVVTIVEDLATSDAAVFARIADRVQSLDISILVNNAGDIRYGPFDSLSPADITTLISLNCTSLVLLTRALLPKLQGRPGKSLVINVSSMTGVVPTAYVTLYSATKAFVRFFSLALREEVRGKVDVFAATPSRINTKLPGYPGVSPDITSGEETVAGLLHDATTTAESFCSFKHFWLHYKLSFLSFAQQVAKMSAGNRAKYQAILKAKADLVKH